MNEEIIFKWDRESVVKCFEKVGRQKVKYTVHSPNRQKFA